MEKLEKLYEGKAKQLYATDDPEVLWVEYKNTATAGDGEKKEDFTGKGRLNNLITPSSSTCSRSAASTATLSSEWTTPASWCAR